MEEEVINHQVAIEHRLQDDGVFPNNSSLPLVFYKSALNLPRSGAGSIVEKIFKKNEWVNSWRNGIYEYHHYHSTAHEVLGVYKGNATVQMGGPSGITMEISKGDVIVIPAGVAHKNLGSSDDFKCVGAYPRNSSDYDINYGKPGERPKTEENIKQVPLPETDPLYGEEDGLISSWKNSN